MQHNMFTLTHFRNVAKEFSLHDQRNLLSSVSQTGFAGHVNPLWAADTH